MSIYDSLETNLSQIRLLELKIMSFLYHFHKLVRRGPQVKNRRFKPKSIAAPTFQREHSDCIVDICATKAAGWLFKAISVSCFKSAK